MKLIGNWGERQSQPDWLISADSIYYYADRRSYGYTITEGDLLVHRGESYVLFRDIRVLNDTLTFIGNQGQAVIAYRLRKTP